ncbi:MAG: ATP-binding cassette domain-containing protein [Alphaproteobacteria bacterium]|nr:ATP-binding cassette domain-containing protein [Alphaproteobacteria bacterium]
MTVLVDVQNLTRWFPVGRAIPFVGAQRVVTAAHDVSFEVHQGETLGLVGESGCGKSTIGKLVLGLLAPSGGTVRFRGREVSARRGSAEWRQMRRQMQMVFQNPFGALNPRLKIGTQISEILDTHAIGEAADRPRRLAELLQSVGLEAHMLERYPHQMSGGQLQRAVIARALAVSPSFIVCDEAVAALDVSIQAQVVNLLLDLQEAHGLTYLFISHDLGIVRHICDRVVVMYLGRMVETGPTAEVFSAPSHPYTRALIAAAPQPDPRARRQGAPLDGDPPSPLNPPSGCVFLTRCPMATSECTQSVPVLRDLGSSGHTVACHHADKLETTEETARPFEPLEAAHAR